LTQNRVAATKFATIPLLTLADPLAKLPSKDHPTIMLSFVLSQIETLVVNFFTILEHKASKIVAFS
jgi:fumarate reductase subunit D